MKTAKQTQPDPEALRQQALLRLSVAPLEAGLAADEAGEAALRAEAAENAARDAASDAAGEAARARRSVEDLTPADPHKQMLAELASREGGALLRIGPRRNRWRELQRYDQELAELEHAREEISRRLGERTAALHQEPDRHAAELADYFGNGSEGARPESRAPTLEREIADLRAEHKALDVRHDVRRAVRSGGVPRRRRSVRRGRAGSRNQRRRTGGDGRRSRARRPRRGQRRARLTSLYRARRNSSRIEHRRRPNHHLSGDDFKCSGLGLHNRSR